MQKNKVVNVVVLRLVIYYAGNFWDNPRTFNYKLQKKLGGSGCTSCSPIILLGRTAPLFPEFLRLCPRLRGSYGEMYLMDFGCKYSTVLNVILYAVHVCTCIDVDECSTTSGICSNGRCENFMGGYECLCDPGFQPSPQKTSCQGFHSFFLSHVLRHHLGYSLVCAV